MEKYAIFKIIISVMAIVICSYGVKQDRKERKFSNNKIIGLIVLGVFMAYLIGRLKYGMITFMAMNVVGIIMSSLGVLGASDWKLFSTMCLFLPFENPAYSLTFGSVFIGFAFIQKILNTKKGMLKQAFLDEWNALKVWIYTKERLVEDEKREVYKQSTIPATEGLVLGFAVCLLMLL